MKKVFISWGKVNKLLDKIHEQCGDQVEYVAGIPRGGVILAILYSHRFNVEYMEYPSNHYPHLLILDDIADSGNTLKQWKERLNVPLYGTLHYKKSSCIEPDFYGSKLIKEDRWIVYPWEKKDSNTIQNYLEN
jgi:hypoxanthine phosphoribosyltransferase|tara:strand:- start:1969 stop:2367 length:399 start_codon:yes stop_codon:yes gene_type:complete